MNSSVSSHLISSHLISSLQASSVATTRCYHSCERNFYPWGLPAESSDLPDGILTMVIEVIIISFVLFVIAELTENNRLLTLVVNYLANSNNPDADFSHPNARRRLNFDWILAVRRSFPRLIYINRLIQLFALALYAFVWETKYLI